MHALVDVPNLPSVHDIAKGNQLLSVRVGIHRQVWCNTYMLAGVLEQVCIQGSSAITQHGLCTGKGGAHIDPPLDW